MTQEQDIVERLQATASNLRKNLDNAAFGDDNTFVRVKAPDLLMADLIEAAQTIATLRAEKAQAHKNWRNRAEAAEAKVKELEAMLRGADEILMEHQEIADTAIRERDEARKALEPFANRAERFATSLDGDEDAAIVTVGDLRRARAVLAKEA